MGSKLYEAPPIVATSTHDVLFQLPLKQDGLPKPSHPNHLNSSGKAVLVMPSSTERWKLICKAYETCPQNFEELRKAINSYNNFSEENGNFKGLQSYIEQDLNADERKEFFKSLLPKIISLALSLPKEVLQPIPLLVKNNTSSISLSQKQISVLLANGFLCTLPDRKTIGAKCGFGDYPDINFNRLFVFERTQPKFQCFFNYFERITRTVPDGVVTFTRQSLQEVPDFSASQKLLTRLTLKLEGGIEDAKNHCQVDFADKYIGGMIFTFGCVQEEIRFLLCPELVVSRLFTEVLHEKEALVVTGVEQYNVGKEYGKKFKFVSSFSDDTPRDHFKRRRCQLIAIDALSFSRRTEDQYKEQYIYRDMYKAYAGFCPIEGTTGKLIPVATGNWGCGVFKGNARFKSLIQLIAASEAGRDITYFAFGKKKLVSDLGALFAFLKNRDTTIGELTQTLLSYERERTSPDPMDIYNFIRLCLCKTGNAMQTED